MQVGRIEAFIRYPLMPEAVPADIMAAIDAFEQAVEAAMFEGTREHDAEQAQAKLNLQASIALHLGSCAEMKAALERIEAGR